MKKRISFLAFISAIFLSALTVSCILLIDEEPHEHTFDKTKWMSDEVCHWHAATCAHVYEEADRAVHSFGDGKVTKKPTLTEKGEKTFVCSVCEYVYREEIPVLDSDEDNPSGGGDEPSEGGNTPNEGGVPSEGGDTPNEGDVPSEGGDTPSGGNVPSDGGVPSEGGNTPNEGETPNEGGNTPSGGDTPNEGGGNTPTGEEDVDDEGVRNWNKYVANGWIVVENGIVQPVAEENKEKIVGKIAIPNSVIGFESWAFDQCRKLTGVVFPNSIENTGLGTFFGCDSLTTIKFSDSITTIGVSSFYSCISLEKIEISASVTNIEHGAFSRSAANVNVSENNAFYSSEDGVLFNKDKTTLIHCPAGKTGSYRIPNSVTTIGDEAFSCCEALESVEIPNSVTTIETCAFLFCPKLTRIEIPTSVTSIGYFAFGHCSGLESVEIPVSVTDIKGGAFCDCAKLTNISVSAGNSNYISENGILFSKDKKTLVQYPAGKTGNYVIPNYVETIGEAAFEGCENITSIKIPNSVTIIEDEAFYACINLTSIELSSSIIRIGRAVFLFTKITSIVIPASVTKIDIYAFDECTELTSVAFEDTTGWYLSEGSTQKTPIDVRNPSVNATELKDDGAWCQNWLVKNP